MSETWDVIVVGGGPAGLSAAVNLGRARRRVVVVDEGLPRNRFSTHLHGALGHDGVDPAELLRRGRDEAARYGVEFRVGRVRSVAADGATVSTRLAGGGELSARALIVATGVSDQLPDIPGLADRWGTSVLHCPYCHGWEVRDGRIGVLALPPMGLHLAQLLRQWTDDLVVFTAALGELDDATTRRLRSRGVRLVTSAVAEVLGDGPRLTGVRTVDGQVIELDALFASAPARPQDGFLSDLGLRRVENPMGSFLSVDETGATSHDRIWAVGNVVSAGANVPMSMGAGSLTGGFVNMVLVTEDFDRADHPDDWPEVAPADFWEERYSGADRVWSGRVNSALADVAGALSAGSALDLGCGEGADVIWLAEHGWRAAGIDISTTAIERARRAARAAGLDPTQASFTAADLSALEPEHQYDLVTASFFHSPVELPRAAILSRAAKLVAPGGHLLVTSHAAAPPWADASAHDHTFPTVESEVADLALAEDEWSVVTAEIRTREARSPEGAPATLDDLVVLARRAG